MCCLVKEIIYIINTHVTYMSVLYMINFLLPFTTYDNNDYDGY